MSFSAPTPPDPTQTSNTQQQYNVTAAQDQQKINSFNQSNPYGSMSYSADPNSPSGYSLNTSLSAPQQHLLDIQTGTQGTTGQTAQNLAHNTAGMYSQAPNFTPLDPTGLVTQLNNWQQKYQQPLFNQQSSNLEAQLRDQGLTPGSEAYNNAKNLLARNQGDVQNQFMTNNIGVGQQAQAQNFGQQVENYQLPLQTEASLFGMSGPTGPTFQQTPTAQIQPANYSGAVQSNYDNQMKNYENTWNNIGKLGTAGVGLAMAPMTGGTSLAGMFGKGITGGGWG
jgi:hypothetical protein